MSLHVSLTPPEPPKINFQNEHEPDDIYFQASSFWQNIQKDLNGLGKQVELTKFFAESQIYFSIALFNSKHKSLIPNTTMSTFQKNRNIMVRNWLKLNEYSSTMQKCQDFFNNCFVYMRDSLKKKKTPNITQSPEEFYHDQLSQLHLLAIKSNAISTYYIKRLEDCRRKVIEFSWMLDYNNGRTLTMHQKACLSMKTYDLSLHKLEVLQPEKPEAKEDEPQLQSIVGQGASPFVEISKVTKPVEESIPAAPPNSLESDPPAPLNFVKTSKLVEEGLPSQPNTNLSLRATLKKKPFPPQRRETTSPPRKFSRPIQRPEPLLIKIQKLFNSNTPLQQQKRRRKSHPKQPHPKNIEL